MSSRPASVHPIVSKLFVDVVTQLLPALRETAPAPDAIAPLTHAQARDLLQLAVQLTGREDLGVLAAEAAEPGHFELVELASRTQRTVGDAIETLAALLPMLHTDARLVLTRGPETSQLSLHFPPESAPHPAGYDFAVVTWLIAARRQTAATALAPTRVFLPYPQRPAAALPLARVLDVPFEFDAPHLALEFPTPFLQLPLLRADATLGNALREVAEELVQRSASEQRSPLEHDVRAQLQAALPNGTASAAAIARQLHLSERTLRRKLEAEGLSLRELTDQVRHELALTLVTNPGASTEAVAAELGFSTAQAFHRAFRRWTGQTIQAYRARARRDG